VPVLLVLGPDAPGVNELDDATALRGTDRRKAQAILPADTVIRDAGHCIHRDDPAGWLQALSHVP
jgi:pimeloyl-ACP methyl ester carboxylesterase